MEHKETRIGPYQQVSGTPLYEMCGQHAAMHHPTPYNDGIETMTWDEYCGFVSREAIDKWFHGWKTKLHKHGYHIAVYEVPFELVKFGRLQVVFDRTDLFPTETMRTLR